VHEVLVMRKGPMLKRFKLTPKSSYSSRVPADVKAMIGVNLLRDDACRI
jgi:hypothetical protein